MSDDYNVEMTFRTQDEPKFKELLHPIWYTAVIDQTPSLKRVLFEAVPGTLILEREQLAQAGLSFFGHYCAHGESTPGVFAACNGHHIDALGFKGHPAAFVNSNGTANKLELREAQQYFKIRRQVLSVFGK